MKRIVVTPAGRKRYLSLLHTHLSNQKEDFDEWHLWLNTFDKEDIEYCEALALENKEWIRVVRHPNCKEGFGPYNIHNFFEECTPENLYLRLDDDIIYLAPDFVKTMFDYRLAHPEYFLVYGNIVNNALISHLHMRFGNVAYPQKVWYDAKDLTGWQDPAFAETIHRAFLKDPRDPKWSSAFGVWNLWDNERVSVNAVSWIGNPGKADVDEEEWLSVGRPRELSKTNAILGKAVCAHFAFYPQREHLDATDILEEYRKKICFTS